MNNTKQETENKDSAKMSINQQGDMTEDGAEQTHVEIRNKQKHMAQINNSGIEKTLADLPLVVWQRTVEAVWRRL